MTMTRPPASADLVLTASNLRNLHAELARLIHGTDARLVAMAGLADRFATVAAEVVLLERVADAAADALAGCIAAGHPGADTLLDSLAALGAHRTGAGT